MPKQDLRILLVEDHPFQLIALQILLNNHGIYRLTPAMTASEALSALERNAGNYDLLLCDQRLPDMCGIELIEIATRKGLVENAVLLSGVDASQLTAIENNARKRGLPLLGCLHKPLNALELLSLLATAPCEC
ncbi:response regulator [Pseudomonas sp. NPDC090202]|uniref:response regulator n=1 Tax=unclassified Pseudomonas TaxID=196821 RepID=UPI00382D06BD